MEAEKGAKELVDKFKKYVESDWLNSDLLEQTTIRNTILFNAKQCALYCIDEKIATCNKFYEALTFPCEIKSDGGYIYFKKELESLQKLKDEIENS